LFYEKDFLLLIRFIFVAQHERIVVIKNAGHSFNFRKVGRHGLSDGVGYDGIKDHVIRINPFQSDPVNSVAVLLEFVVGRFVADIDGNQEETSDPD
jgi:hypothetical protein